MDADSSGCIEEAAEATNFQGYLYRDPLTGIERHKRDTKEIEVPHA